MSDVKPNRPAFKKRLGATFLLRSPEPVAACSLQKTNRLTSQLFLTVIALAPLPFGSADLTTVSFWCLLLSVALIFCNLNQIKTEQKLIIGGIFCLLAIFMFGVIAQIVSPPWFNNPEPLWAETQQLLGGPVDASIALPRYVPLYRLGPVLACILSLVLGVVIAADRRMARRVFLVFAWSGVAYALFGIVSALVEPDMILWREREGYIGNVIGTFTYRNTAATYFGVCSIIWFLTLCELIKMRLPRHQLTWKYILWEFLPKMDRKSLVPLGCFFVCVMALLMTTSRAGTVISLSVLISTGFLYFRRDLPKSNNKLVIFSIGIVGVFFLLQFGGSVSQRFDVSGLSDESRRTTYISTFKMIADHPWLGTGLGTFSWAFPHYRGAYPSIFGVWEIAHSTPLELAAEMGLPLAVLVGLGWILVLTVLVRGVLIRRRDIDIPLGGLAVALVSLLHSCVDFPLQISGYAIGAMALIGAGLSQSFRST